MMRKTKVILEVILGLVTLLAFVLSLFYFKGCGELKPKQKVTIPAPEPAPPTDITGCEGLAVGNKRQLVCQDPSYTGYIEQQCKDDGTWETVKTTCKPPPDKCETEAGNKVTFVKDILPIIGEKPEEINGQKNCIACHGSLRLNEYESAKALVDEIINRINLDDLNPRRMPPPQGGAKALEFEQREKFVKWKADGLIEKNECPDDGDNDRVEFNYLDDLETSILNDLQKLDGRGQLNARYLVNDHKHNLGSSDEEMDIYRTGTNKVINAISAKEDDIIPCTPVDNIKGACRIDLEAYDLTSDFWNLIVDNTILVLESDTDKGNFIKQLTGARIPWLTTDQFIRGSVGTPAVYHEIMGIPLWQNEYLEQKGVDFAGDIEDFRAVCVGGNGSPISRRKNRLVCIFESDDGQCSITFDPDEGINDGRNLFLNPLIEVGVDLFQFDASEILCDLPNGEMEMSLWNAAGLRQDEAPTTIVVNVEDPFGDIEIFTAEPCYRCHSKGWIPMQDQVRNHVLRNGASFDRETVEIVKFLYGTQGALDGAFFAQNDRYKRAMAKNGIDVNKPDPINYFSDRFKKDWTIYDVCAFIRIPLDECKQRIGESAVLTAQVGGLLTGGTITQDQFADTFNDFIVELFLGQEPINRQIRE